MSRIWRDIKLIPIVLVAMISLFVLKVSGLVFDGGYTLAERMQGRDKTDMKIVSADSVPDQTKIVIADKDVMPDTAAPKKPWAQQMLNYRDAGKSDITGSVEGGESKPSTPPLKTSNKPPGPPKLDIGGTSIPIEPGHITSPGEVAILERLRQRRQELDDRSHELDMRENLIKAAEKRLEAKVAELKDVESRIKNSVSNRDKAEADRFKGIIAMYENMKSKDAARIFDRLDPNVLIEVATAMKPRSMSEILAQMAPEAAERLTVELANRASARPKSQNPDQLPKIEGKPNNG
jgi:flagellar motility protein MotE (MotC chaperone)